MFNLVAGNGRVVLTSERYKTKASAAKAGKNFDRSKAKNGGSCFVLKASNGEPIARSQVYSGCSGGIASVRRCGPAGKVEDLT